MDTENGRQDDSTGTQPDRPQAPRQTTLSDLPNEVLIQILAHFQTRHLLPLSALSHHFYDLVARLHHARLIEASRLENHVMVLECYHPSVKTFTPTLFCDYLGTDGILDGGGGGGDRGGTAGQGVRLNRLHGLYSRFKPNLYSRASRVPGMGNQAILAESRYRIQRPRSSSEIAQAQAPGTSASGPGEVSGSTSTQPDQDNILAHDLYLDSGELFSQLCTQASIIKIEPQRGLFLSISNVTDGVIRVWRQWLARQAVISAASHGNMASPILHPKLPLEPEPNPGDLPINELDLKDEDTKEPGKSPPHSVILWTDVLYENVGLKFRVVEKPVENAPVLVGPNDEPPVAYTLQYDELLVRTDSLLLSLEKSLAQQVTHAVPLQSFIAMHRRAKQQLLLQAGIDASFLDAHLSPLSSPTGEPSDLGLADSGGGWNAFFNETGTGLFGTLWRTSDNTVDYLQGCMLVGVANVAARLDGFLGWWAGSQPGIRADDKA